MEGKNMKSTSKRTYEGWSIESVWMGGRRSSNEREGQAGRGTIQLCKALAALWFLVLTLVKNTYLACRHHNLIRPARMVGHEIGDVVHRVLVAGFQYLEG